MDLISDWTVTRLSGALGAEVSDVDLAAVDDEIVAAVRELLLEHHVLFFPDQHLTESQHVALGRRFGPLESHPHLANTFTDTPEIFELAASSGGIADEWHTDLTFQEHPAVMSILHMVECPPYGGDTLFANLSAAYDRLSPPMRELCDGLTALHDAHAHGRPDKMWVHPVVRIHPDTGRRALYVSEHFTRRIVEMSHPESDNLLRFLTDWVSDERFTVRYRWTPGTIAMWDNRCTQHYVVNDFESERIIQRVTVTGDTPVGPDGDTTRWDRWPGLRSSAMGRHDRKLDRYFRELEGESGAVGVRPDAVD